MSEIVFFFFYIFNVKTILSSQTLQKQTVCQIWLTGHKLLIPTMCHALSSCFSRVRLFATLWTVACQALLSVGFSRQEYWNALPSPPPGDLPDPGIRLNLCLGQLLHCMQILYCRATREAR